MLDDRRSQQWKALLPIIIFLLIIVGLLLWYYWYGYAHFAFNGVPEVSPFKGSILLIVGVSAGLLGGLVGTGGCSIMLPVLHFWMGYPSPVAIGTTLFAVFFTATSGGYGHILHKNLDIRTTVWLTGFGVVGVIIGSWLFTEIMTDTALLGLILGLAFILPSVRMLWDGLIRTRVDSRGSLIQGSWQSKGAFGAIIEALTGLVGLGGGYALIPGLIYIFGAPVYIAMGISLATMILLASVGGAIKIAQGSVDIGPALLLGSGAIAGAQIGAAIIKRFKPSTLKLILRSTSLTFHSSSFSLTSEF